MEQIQQQLLTGERALFQSKDLQISYCTFADGESPLKESSGLKIDHTLFKWKYPLWYCQDVTIEDSTLFAMARAGIWYTEKLTMKNTVIEAPKTLRRVKQLVLEHVNIPNAEETLWHCEQAVLQDVTAKGDCFGMNCSDLQIKGLQLTGKYSFDGCRNVEMHDSTLITKDAFWNCDNITVYNSLICGEYLGWNSRNLTFVNCTIESLQGLCYIENLVMKNCRLLNTNLAFEYSTVDAQIDSVIDSVKNPKGGKIIAKGIGEVILEADKINPADTQIICG